MNGRIVWIHGMGPKPSAEEEQARTWQALADGLWLGVPADAYSIIYWADLRVASTSSDIGAGEPPLALRLPVRHRASLGWAAGGLGAYTRRPDLLLWNAIERLQRLARLGIDRAEARGGPRLAERIDHLLGDLGPYFGGRTRGLILERMVKGLDEEARKGPLCVISHSAGTVLALDAIIQWGGEVDTFVTMGAPLGWEYVREALGSPAYPPNVRHWINLCDRVDDVAIRDHRLAGVYPATSGARLIADHVVRDNYTDSGDRDPHHWFGYLSSPDVADLVGKFWLGLNAGVPAIQTTAPDWMVTAKG